MFVLSYKVGSLVALATLVGVAFLFGGMTQLVVTNRVPTMRGLSILAAGSVSLVYVVSILVAWYLVVLGITHIVSALGGPKLSWWWTGLLLGISELVLGGVGSRLLINPPPGVQDRGDVPERPPLDEPVSPLAWSSCADPAQTIRGAERPSPIMSRKPVRLECV